MVAKYDDQIWWPDLANICDNYTRLNECKYAKLLQEGTTESIARWVKDIEIDIHSTSISILNAYP